MNISLNCKLSLSKKLRALIDKEASLTLVSQDIVDGKGTAILTLNSDNIPNQFDSKIGETSIMLTPVEITEESPNAQSPVHASLFSTVPKKHQKEPVVTKIAVVNAPEKGEESRAIKEEVEVPEVFSEVKNEECKVWVKNMEDMVAAINVAKGKKSDIDLDSAHNDRERAILQEMKEKEEAIDIPAWIVNDKVGMLSVNDLNISLPMNVPYDLSNISARRILMSKELRGLLKEGYIRFVSLEEKDQFILRASGELETIDGIDVFDNHEKAMENMESEKSSSGNPVIDEKNAMTITEEDIESKTEEESMVLNLTQNMPTVKTNRSVPVGNRKTTHANISSETPKNPNIKTVRKVSREE